MTPTNDDEERTLSRGLIDCYFSGRYNQQLVSHQIDSFNDFVSNKLDLIISNFDPVDILNGYLPEHGCYRYILSLSLKNPALSRPTIQEKDGSTKAMLPNDARLRNLTYAAPLTVDVHITAKTFSEGGTADGGRGTGDKTYVSERKEIKNVNLGRIPIMVRSRYCMLSHPNYIPNGMDECRYDYGGYFIINGSEKVVVSQDRIAENRTYVFVNTKASCYSHVAEIRSVQESRFGVPKTLTLKLASKPNQFGRSIKISIHHIKHDIPITILFRALGMESDREIARVIVRGAWGQGQEQDNYDYGEQRLVEALAASFDEGSSIRTVQGAQEYMAAHLAASNHHYNAGALAGGGSGFRGPSQEQRIGALRSVLTKDLLPHVGPTLLKKALYVGHMAARLIECSLGIRPLDDRDSYINKRLDTPGVLLANLFRQYYGKAIKDLRSLVQKDINHGSWRASNRFINVVGKSNIYKLIKPTTIEAGLKYGLATGNWGVKTSRMRQGVAQVLNRLTYIASLSHLRRVNTPIEKTGKLVQPRKLHSTQWGMVCPSETPEGASVGLVKNLALLTNITVSAPSDPVHSVLDELGLLRFDGSGRLSPADALAIFGPRCVDSGPLRVPVRVYVNGDLVGAHEDPSKLCRELRQLKRQGAINVFTSISWAVTSREVHICTDGGRFVRPLLVVDPHTGKPVLDGMPELYDLAKKGKAVWHDLVLSGAIEYLDGDEVEGVVIAMTRGDLTPDKRTTHMEVSPSAMLGVVAGSIPYSDHNQAPRNCFPAADHEVLTEHGFLGLDEILEHTADGKELGVACHVDGRLEFHKIGRDRVVYQDDHGLPLTATEFVSFESKKTLCERKIPAVASRGVSLLATTNHNMYGRLGLANKPGKNFYVWPSIGYRSVPPEYKTHEAGDIMDLKLDGTSKVPVFQPRCNFPKGISAPCGDLPFVGHLDLVTDDQIDAFLWLYGYWLGDGWLEGIYISVGPKKLKDVDELTKVFARLPLPQLTNRLHGAHGYWKAPSYDSKGQWMFSICSSKWWDYFAQQYAHKYAEDINSAKWFWPWVFNALNPTQLKTVLEGLRYADGNQSVKVSSGGTIHTSSARFRDEVERICILAGYSVLSRHGTGIPGKPCGTNAQGVNIIAKHYAWNVIYTTASVSATPYMMVGEEITRVKMQDPVPIFCVSVPTESHLIMVRRKATYGEPASRATIVGNTYQSAMGKQAIGIYSSNFRHRFDTMAHALNYPQKPLVSTHTARITNCDNLPCGINTIVAIACFTGFNQEDSVIVNRSAVERGLFVSTFYRTFREQNNKNHSTGEEEFFCRPDPAVTRNMKPHNYGKVGQSGFVDENTFVEGGDVIIGKCMPQKQGHTVTHKDTSVALKSNERGYIDRNCSGNRHFTNVTGDGYTFAKVRLRQERVPTIGDKVSCYTGDHEVLTEMHGWVPIGEVDPTVHKVASLVDGGRMAYLTPTRVQSYKYWGPMVGVQGPGIDILVTPEHRMWVASSASASEEYGIELAGTFMSGKKLTFQRTVKAYEGSTGATHRTDTFGNVYLLKQLGRWVAEKVWVTSIVSGRGTGTGTTRQPQQSPKLPAWFSRLSTPDARAFLSGLFVTKEFPPKKAGATLMIPCSTPEFATCIQQLSLHAGIHCEIEFPFAKVGGVPPCDAYVQEGWSTEEIDVYCCTVPEGPGVIYVRRKGPSGGVWCGNSRHGQKGTIGMTYREEDMPFTSSGLIPSLIMNPHAIPSRMTIGQLMEAIDSKAGALSGHLGDATPFNGRTVEDIAAELETLGAHRHGDEIMYNPRTGEQVPCAVFLCPTYYQRLKHMVEDKVHSRAANGPVVLMTRQPAEGRARDGGLRIGEMEVEAIWAHGMLHFLKERFVECSDNYRVFVCTKCGMMSTVNPEQGIYNCKACKNITEFAEIRIPYASKLLLQEIQTMSIGAKFIVDGPHRSTKKLLT